MPEKLTRDQRLRRYREWRKGVRTCTLCPLWKGRTQVVVDSGNPGSRLAVVAEAPGRVEDEQGKVLVGKSGQILRRLLKTAGISPERDTIMFNILMCQPPKNKFPKDEIVQACQGHTQTKFDLLRPEICILAGRQATNWILFPETRDARIGRLSGQKLRLSKSYPFVRYFLPIYHPAFLMRQEDSEEKRLSERIVQWFKEIRTDLKRNRIPYRGEDIELSPVRRTSLFS